MAKVLRARNAAAVEMLIDQLMVSVGSCRLPSERPYARVAAESLRRQPAADETRYGPSRMTAGTLLSRD